MSFLFKNLLLKPKQESETDSYLNVDGNNSNSETPMETSTYLKEFDDNAAELFGQTMSGQTLSGQTISQFNLGLNAESSLNHVQNSTPIQNLNLMNSISSPTPRSSSNSNIDLNMYSNYIGLNQDGLQEKHFSETHFSETLTQLKTIYPSLNDSKEALEYRTICLISDTRFNPECIEKIKSYSKKQVDELTQFSMSFNPHALLDLALCYMYGIQVEQSFDRAHLLIQRASFGMPKEFWDQKDKLPQSFQCLLKVLPIVVYFFGFFLREHPLFCLGAIKNEERDTHVYYCFMDAARLGLDIAQFSLAQLYINNIGIPENEQSNRLELALKYCSLAKEQGLIEAEKYFSTFEETYKDYVREQSILQTSTNFEALAADPKNVSKNPELFMHFIKKKLEYFAGESTEIEFVAAEIDDENKKMKDISKILRDQFISIIQYSKRIQTLKIYNQKLAVHINRANEQSSIDMSNSNPLNALTQGNVGLEQQLVDLNQNHSRELDELIKKLDHTHSTKTKLENELRSEVENCQRSANYLKDVMKATQDAHLNLLEKQHQFERARMERDQDLIRGNQSSGSSGKATKTEAIETVPMGTVPMQKWTKLSSELQQTEPELDIGLTLSNSSIKLSMNPKVIFSINPRTNPLTNSLKNLSTNHSTSSPMELSNPSSMHAMGNNNNDILQNLINVGNKFTYELSNLSFSSLINEVRICEFSNKNRFEKIAEYNKGLIEHRKKVLKYIGFGDQFKHTTEKSINDARLAYLSSCSNPMKLSSLIKDIAKLHKKEALEVHGVLDFNDDLIAKLKQCQQVLLVQQLKLEKQKPAAKAYHFKVKSASEDKLILMREFKRKSEKESVPMETFTKETLQKETVQKETVQKETIHKKILHKESPQKTQPQVTQPQETQSQNTQAQETQPQNTQTQNTQANNTQTQMTHAQMTQQQIMQFQAMQPQFVQQYMVQPQIVQSQYMHPQMHPYWMQQQLMPYPLYPAQAIPSQLMMSNVVYHPMMHTQWMGPVQSHLIPIVAQQPPNLMPLVAPNSSTEPKTEEETVASELLNLFQASSSNKKSSNANGHIGVNGNKRRKL